MLEALRDKAKRPSLTVDSGNLLFPRTVLAGNEQDLANSAFALAGTYTAAGVDAINVGPEDMVAGPDLLASQYKTNWVSASLYATDGAPLFPLYRIAKAGDTVIGITGITSIPNNLSVAGTFLQKPWKIALKPVISKLEKDTDFIILLSTLSQKENEQVVAQFPSIRIVVASSSSASNANPRLMGNCLFTQTAEQGKYLGSLIINDPKDGFTLNDPRVEFKKYEKRLQELKDSEAQVKDKGPEIQARLSKRMEIVENKLNRLQKRIAAEGNRSYATFTSRFYAIEEHLPENSEISSFINNVLKIKKGQPYPRVPLLIQ